MTRREQYQSELKHPKWQKRRLEVLEYANWRCQLCGDKDTTLHCHHSYYLRGKKPWQYPQGAIIALCETCHGKQHPEKKYPEQKPEPIGEVELPPCSQAKARASFDEIFAMLGKIKDDENPYHKA